MELQQKMNILKIKQLYYEPLRVLIQGVSQACVINAYMIYINYPFVESYGF